MAKIKFVRIFKKEKNSYDVRCNTTKWTNINNYQVVGRLANIIELELRKNKKKVTGKYDIIIIPK